MTHNNRTLGARQEAILIALAKHLPTAMSIAMIVMAIKADTRQVKRTIASLNKAGLVVSTPENDVRLTAVGKALAGIEATPEVEKAPEAKPEKAPRKPKTPKVEKVARKRDIETASIMADSTMRLPVGCLPFPPPPVAVIYHDPGPKANGEVGNEIRGYGCIEVRPAKDDETGRRAKTPKESIGAEVAVRRVLKEAGLDARDIKGRYRVDRNAGHSTMICLGDGRPTA